MEKKINYTTSPIPSGPGAQQITVEGQKSLKGGSSFTSSMPATDSCAPAPSKVVKK